MSERPEPGSTEALERRVHGLVHNLPLRRAPASLEAAVLAEIARRAALPWWRLSFAQWPAGARIVFVLVCLALVVLTLLAGGLHQFGAVPLAFVQGVANGVSAALGFAAIFVRLIPSPWLYAGLLVGALLYALLFGLGAFAYRTLYLAPLHGR
jgi:hypothetical protein